MGKQPDCILNMGCPHVEGGGCRALGRCGADHVLRKSRRPEGYRVILRENATVDALVKERVCFTVCELGQGASIATVRACES